MPDDIRVDLPNDYLMAELGRLKGLLYRKRTQARLEQDVPKSVRRKRRR